MSSEKAPGKPVSDPTPSPFPVPAGADGLKSTSFCGTHGHIMCLQGFHTQSWRAPGLLGRLWSWLGQVQDALGLLDGNKCSMKLFLVLMFWETDQKSCLTQTRSTRLSEAVWRLAEIGPQLCTVPGISPSSSNQWWLALMSSDFPGIKWWQDDDYYIEWPLGFFLFLRFWVLKLVLNSGRTTRDAQPSVERFWKPRVINRTHLLRVSYVPGDVWLKVH